MDLGGSSRFMRGVALLRGIGSARRVWHATRALRDTLAIGGQFTAFGDESVATVGAL